MGYWFHCCLNIRAGQTVHMFEVNNLKRAQLFTGGSHGGAADRLKIHHTLLLIFLIIGLHTGKKSEPYLLSSGLSVCSVVVFWILDAEL